MPHLFSPSWLKKADRFGKGVKKFIAYQSDLMASDKLESVQALRGDYFRALKAKDRAQLAELEPKLLKACEGAVPHYGSSPIKENVEVIIIAIIVALGIRAYYLQPFKIPTASMQPTLNGITAGRLTAEQPLPNFLSQAWQYVWRGRNYVEKILPAEWGETRLERYRQYSKVNFFTFTELGFANGQTMRVYSPAKQLFTDLWRDETLSNWARNLGSDDTRDWVKLPLELPVRGGEVIAKGYVDTGDQLLVDKVSYHFSRPKRGEVFVFSTRSIARIGERQVRDGMPPDVSQHYIKRLAALPGDCVRIESPKLYINGSEAQEQGLQRVMSAKDGYRGYGVPSQDPQAEPHRDYIKIDPAHFGKTLDATIEDKRYLALGDNSYASFDSRNWGPVPEENLVGPALFVYWPFSPHWGLIR